MSIVCKNQRYRNEHDPEGRTTTKTIRASIYRRILHKNQKPLVLMVQSLHEGIEKGNFLPCETLELQP